MGSVVLQGVTLLGSPKTRKTKKNIVSPDTSALTMMNGKTSLNVINGLTRNSNRIIENNQSSDDGSSSGGGSDSSDGSSGGSSDSSGGSSTSNTVKSTMSKSERQKLYKMKDSNVPYFYSHDENDLTYLAASEK